MHHNDKFRKVVKEMFKVDVKTNYLPDQTYINLLISSLNRADPNCYSQCHPCFISEYIYLEKLGTSQFIKAFVDGCLYQLLWINTILESGKVASTEEELEENWGYETPVMLGNPWTLDKVTKKGAYFRGDEPFQDSRVIINSDNIIEIVLALSNVVEKIKLVKNVKESPLIKAKELVLEVVDEQTSKGSKNLSTPVKMTEKEKIKNYCMKLLKEKLYPPKYK